MTDESKQQLRERFLTRRRALGEQAIAAARVSVREHVVREQSRRGWSVVAAYRPLRTEPGSVELLDALIARGVRVIVPVTLPDRDLDWVTLSDESPLGRDAVAAADAVLVPALAVARDGTRLGRGGGSYDRALTRVGEDAAVAALLHDGEVVSELAADPWDVPVTAHVTPGGGWVQLTPGALGNP